MVYLKNHFQTSPSKSLFDNLSTIYYIYVTGNPQNSMYMYVQIIKLKSNLPEEELLIRAKERKPQFEATSGLLQKYYVRRNEPGHYAGIYIWESKEAMAAYKNSELAAGIPAAYEISEPPSIEIMDLLFQLRE